MTAISATAVPRPLRRDAEVNRRKILEAASQVFAEHGLDGSVEEVARVAGVGMGTLYRRFPTKQALVDQLVGDARRELLIVAQAALRHEDGTGLEQLLHDAGRLQAERVGCRIQVWDQSDAELDTMNEFRRAVARLLASAQLAGRIRPEVTRNDISLIFWSVRGVIETTRDIAPDAWRRHLELLVAGTRPVSGARFSDGRFSVGPFTDTLSARPLTDTETRRITGADIRR